MNDIVLVRAVQITSDFIKCSFELNNSQNQNSMCFLLSLSFYNTTKRNRPKIVNNQIILARIIKINESILLTCAEEWLGPVDLLIEKYLQSTSISSDCVLNMVNVMPLVCLNIFMTGIESDLLILVGMNGFVAVYGECREVNRVSREIKRIYQ